MKIKKKRAVKYNPNKMKQRNVALLHKDKAERMALAAQPRELEMTFNYMEVNQKIKGWVAANNTEKNAAVPEAVVYHVYHGDLIVALKNQLVPIEQEWFLGVDSHYYNYETDNVLTVPCQWHMPLMSFNDFQHGCDVKVDRGNGIKTRWKGVNIEVAEFLENEIREGYTYIRSDMCMRIETAFNNWDDYLYFEHTKANREKIMATVDMNI